MRRLPRRQSGEDFIRRGEAEVVLEHDDILPVDAALGAVPHDQRRGEHQLLLQPEVRMHPVGAGMRQIEGVLGALARRHRRLRSGLLSSPKGGVSPCQWLMVGSLLSLRRRALESLGSVEVEARPPRLVEDAKDRRRSALHLDDARPHRQVADRRRRPRHPR
jgi:hypothetical protein